MKAILVLAVLLGLTASAAATTYYVKPPTSRSGNPGGLDSHTGLDSTSAAFATVARGLQFAAAPGDIVKVLGGNYDEGIETREFGSFSGWLTVTGDVANPGNVTLNGNLTIAHDYNSVRGIQFAGNFERGCNYQGGSFGCGNPAGIPARHDSVSWCAFVSPDSSGVLGFGYAPTTSANDNLDLVFYGNTGALHGVWMNCFDSECRHLPTTDGLVYHNADGTVWPGQGFLGRVRGVTFRRNTFTFRSYDLFRQYNGDHLWFGRGMTGWTIDSNRVLLIQRPNSDASWQKLYFAQRNQWKDNHWWFDGLQAIPHYWYQRDSSAFNTWNRDTFDLAAGSGTSTPIVLLENSGDTDFNGRNGHNSWKNCVWRNGRGNGIAFQMDMKDDTLSGSTIATTGVPLTFISGMAGDNVIDHCTFADSTTGGGLIMGPGSKRPWTGTFKLKSNIFYSKDKLGTNRSAVNFMLPRGNPLESNNNFFVMWDSSAVFADRSLTYYTTEADGSLQSGIFNSRPDSTTWRTLVWGANVLPDLNSRVAGRAKGTGETIISGKPGPKFTDSTFTTFDSRILSGSGAMSVGEGGSDAGAFQQTTADAVRPDDPQDLYVAGQPRAGPGSTWEVTLEFTATGDDSLTNRAHHYEVRYSTGLIDAAHFDTATPFATAQMPALPLAIDRITVTGLGPTTTYYFAIKVVDDAGNKSAISSVVSARTGGAGGGTNYYPTE